MECVLNFDGVFSITVDSKVFTGIDELIDHLRGGVLNFLSRNQILMFLLESMTRLLCTKDGESITITGNSMFIIGKTLSDDDEYILFVMAVNIFFYRRFYFSPYKGKEKVFDFGVVNSFCLLDSNGNYWGSTDLLVQVPTLQELDNRMIERVGKGKCKEGCRGSPHGDCLFWQYTGKIWLKGQCPLCYMAAMFYQGGARDSKRGPMLTSLDGDKLFFYFDQQADRKLRPVEVFNILQLVPGSNWAFQSFKTFTINDEKFNVDNFFALCVSSYANKFLDEKLFILSKTSHTKKNSPQTFLVHEKNRKFIESFGVFSHVPFIKEQIAAFDYEAKDCPDKDKTRWQCFTQFFISDEFLEKIENLEDDEIRRKTFEILAEAGINKFVIV